ncbi:hypothetical protein B0T25DRAFT_528416 [Lasiosphaeria hispida]|uniref:DUF7580 domain-containing protein n=1 Tax=Lasiosphaeria hispida TaxID=260671 RepID=A0AAJ0MKH9_9PEZI|nr:hypothetical protein B0T25DRAFT_528416 [Lasiosphaeria hispida]
MSGFEVAGILLGAFPVAINALEAYRDVATQLGVFYRIRLEHKKWRDDLEFYQLKLKTHLRQLLVPLGVNDTTITDLFSDLGGEGWREQWISDLLRMRLNDSNDLYVRYILGMQRVMDDVNRELAVDPRLVQEKMNSPKAPTTIERLKSAFTKEGRTFQLYKLKFSTSEAARRKLFGQLDEYIRKLEALLDISEQNANLGYRQTSVTGFAAADEALCSFWLQASKLFKAITSAWGCPCSQHDAKLLLQHRTSLKEDFQVIFTQFASSQWEICRTRISGSNSAGVEATPKESTPPFLDSVPIRAPNHRNETPKKSAFWRSGKVAGSAGVAWQPSSLTLTEVGTCNVQTTTAPITALCALLRQPSTPYCGYLAADEDGRYHIYTVSHRTVPTFHSITLDQLLLGTDNTLNFPKLTREQRYTLSLTIASSFLQLFHSPWLPPLLQKSDIFFTTSTSTPQGLPLLDQPHLNSTFTSTTTTTINNNVGNSSTPTTQAPQVEVPHYTDALSHLGIILLELCFGARLDEQPHRTQWPFGSCAAEKAVFDVAAAREWQRDVKEEAGFAYAEAVGWCLGGCAQLGGITAAPERWRRDMLRRVVLPLQRCCEYLKRDWT